jgi:transcriptional regulator with GAF, ATPase, and Fis domain
LSALSSPLSRRNSPSTPPPPASSTAAASPHAPGSLAPAASGASGFAELDERLRSGTPGVLIVQVASAAASEAVASHLARCARSVGATVLEARSRAGSPIWRDIAVRMGMTVLDSNPRQCAEQIAARSRADGSFPTVIVTPIPWIGTWDRSVAAELGALGALGATAAAPHALLTVFVADASDPARDLCAERFEVSGSLGSLELSKWWSAVAEEAGAVVDASDLVSLHGWWELARRTPLDTEPPTFALTPEARDLLSALDAAGRPWPVAEVAALVEADARVGRVEAAAAFEELRSVHAVHVEGGWVLLSDPGDVGPMTPVACERVALAVLARFANDGWARARAAELLLRASRFDRADVEHAAALTLIDDAAARQELVGRWMAEVSAVPEEAQLPLRMQSAERALGIGEADEAHRWAQTAAMIAPQDPKVTLLLGRASVAMGDLVAAKVTLDRGRAAADNPQMSALIAVELSEVAYLNGDFAEAAREANRAIELTQGDPAQCGTALRARNTLGKLLLSRSSWAEADRHFAEDALMAMAHGLETAELRARLNRGIALMSSGSLDEARAIFDAVLVEGERIGDPRACAFALDNLSVVATWRHEYASALTLSERTLNLRQRLGDRLTMARILGNLAELRRKLGLFDHAEHAIAFGRRAIGPGMPPERSAHFSFVAARLALARGRTAEAAREVARALADGETAGHRMILAEAHRVATRIALDDGDLARAHASLDRAVEQSLTDDARAEVAVLTALLARAEGRNAEALALEALASCRTAGEEELLREVHVLLCELYRNAGKLSQARAHLEQAVVLRDEIAGDLPSDVKAAFLARADVVALGRLQTLLSLPEPALEEEPATRRPPPPGHARGELPREPREPREIVGDDPAIRGLQVAIRKVARANSTVLIRGESGTGKELVAEALHRASDRADGPLVTVNCAALVETLLLSELFGHEKGAFTGAVARRRGRFELAEGGTLFLDEIGDISPKTQVALLRVLQERTFERVGGTTAVRANVRIICATHRDLKAMVERGEFREDLYYRLRGITLEVPPLRMRMGDLPRIAEHLLSRIAVERGETTKTLSPDAIGLLGRHRWPGNVRELENALRAASLFAESHTITAQNLLDNVDDLRQASGRSLDTRGSDRGFPAASPSFDSVAPAGATDAADDGDDAETTPLPATESNATAVAYSQVRHGSVSLSEMKRQIERDCIARALAETKGNITRAAALLGMKRPRLSQLVKQYGFAAVSSED